MQNENQSELSCLRFPALDALCFFVTLIFHWLLVRFPFALIGLRDYLGSVLRHSMIFAFRDRFVHRSENRHHCIFVSYLDSGHEVLDVLKWIKS